MLHMDSRNEKGRKEYDKKQAIASVLKYIMFYYKRKKKFNLNIKTYTQNVTCTLSNRQWPNCD